MKPIENKAVIDVGSNSIKLLVANRAGVIHEGIRGVRTGVGLGKKSVMELHPESSNEALEAIKELHQEALDHGASEVHMVGTAALREASNTDDFIEKVREATGVTLDIISEKEEAQWIAKGVQQDPHLDGIEDFCVFDLGGGSLECIHFKGGEIVFLRSFPLGAVRVTEKYIRSPQVPIDIRLLRGIESTIEDQVEGFPHRGVPLVGLSGALKAARDLIGCEAVVKLKDLEEALKKVASLTLEDRMGILGIPAFRADIIPAALATIIALAQKGGCKEIIHSSYNLRYGIMAKLLN